MSDSETFAKQGFIGPMPLLTKAQATLLVKHYLALAKKRTLWEKSLATVDPLTHEVATNPELVRRLRELIGDDIVLWGGSVIVRRPGEIHRWHCDIESCGPEGGFVTVWIGLENTRQESSLTMIPGSHAYGVTLQELTAREKISRNQRTDDAILRLANAQQPGAEIASIEANDGEGVFFDGRIWHGSHNTSPNLVRIALLLQYARSDIRIKVPDFKHLEWPFRFTDEPQPVIAVSGQGELGRNPIVPPPTMRQPTAIQPCAHPIDPNSRCKDGVSFTPVRCFEGRTDNVDYLECHYSILMPGFSPHAPHAHLDEEILVVMSGAAELVFAQSSDDAVPKIFAAPAGTAIYYPPFQHHTIRNVSTEPVRYAMLRWRSPAVSARTHLPPHFVRSTWVQDKNFTGKVAMKNLFEGPSAFLAKLHGHVTRIEPGAGYAAHRDSHDVSIFLIEGEIAVMGNRIAAPGVVFFPAHTLHDMKSVGAKSAKYLVWEFHRTLPRQAPQRARVAAPARSDAGAVRQRL